MTARRASAARPWIDPLEFARSGGELGASQTLAQLHRLADLLVDDEGGVEWHLAGERRARPEGGTHAFLVLRLRGSVRLTCVRCLEPVRVELDEERLFKIAATESQAEREDTDTDEYDVLAQAPRFDVLDLVEDETIMALPIAPRHADCALPAQAAAAPGARARGGGRDTGRGGAQGDAAGTDGEAPRPNPFAALEVLRRRGRGNGGGG